MAKRRIRLTERQLYRLIEQTTNEALRHFKTRKFLSRRVNEGFLRNIRESINSDNTLYQHIADCIKKDLQQEFNEYRLFYRERINSKTGEKYIIPYDNNLYDKIEVPTYIRYKPNDNTLIFGTIYSWFEYEYDFLIGCGVGTSALSICHVNGNMRALDEPKPFPVNLKQLNKLIGAFDSSDSETDEEDTDTEPF